MAWLSAVAALAQTGLSAYQTFGSKDTTDNSWSQNKNFSANGGGQLLANTVNSATNGYDSSLYNRLNQLGANNLQNQYDSVANLQTQFAGQNQAALERQIKAQTDASAAALPDQLAQARAAGYGQGEGFGAINLARTIANSNAQRDVNIASLLALNNQGNQNLALQTAGLQANLAGAQMNAQDQSYLRYLQGSQNNQSLLNLIANQSGNGSQDYFGNQQAGYAGMSQGLKNLGDWGMAYEKMPSTTTTTGGQPSTVDTSNFSGTKYFTPSAPTGSFNINNYGGGISGSYYK